jgi:hypothetical protein
MPIYINLKFQERLTLFRLSYLIDRRHLAAVGLQKSKPSEIPEAAQHGFDATVDSLTELALLWRL